MTVSDLITELAKHPHDAEVITPGNHFGHHVLGVTEVVEADPAILTDGSRVEVVMLRSD